MGDMDDLASRPQRRTKAGRLVSSITKEELESCFNMPSEQACRHLGVGPTILKRVCRRFGIPRWPYNRQGRQDDGAADSGGVFGGGGAAAASYGLGSPSLGTLLPPAPPYSQMQSALQGQPGWQQQLQATVSSLVSQQQAEVAAAAAPSLQMLLSNMANGSLEALQQHAQLSGQSELTHHGDHQQVSAFMQQVMQLLQPLPQQHVAAPPTLLCGAAGRQQPVRHPAISPVAGLDTGGAAGDSGVAGSSLDVLAAAVGGSGGTRITAAVPLPAADAVNGQQELSGGWRVSEGEDGGDDGLSDFVELPQARTHDMQREGPGSGMQPKRARVDSKSSPPGPVTEHHTIAVADGSAGVGGGDSAPPAGAAEPSTADTAAASHRQGPEQHSCGKHLPSSGAIASSLLLQNLGEHLLAALPDLMETVALLRKAAEQLHMHLLSQRLLHSHATALSVQLPGNWQLMGVNAELAELCTSTLLSLLDCGPAAADKLKTSASTPCCAGGSSSVAQVAVLNAQAQPQ